MNDGQRAGSTRQWGGRVATGLLLGTLLLLGYLVVAGFLAPLVWAAILAYLTWPLNRRIRRLLRGHRGAAALLMTAVLCFAIVLPLLAGAVSLRQELGGVFEQLKESLQGGAAALPAWLTHIPWVGPRLSELADHVAAEPQIVGQWLAQRSALWLGEAADVVGTVGRNAFKLVLAVVVVFFFYRDGERLVADVRRGLRALLGSESDSYWTTTTDMTQAVVYGLVLTALAQGALAGLGYWAVGLNAPVLLGSITALLALVPFGAPVVWGSIAVWVLWQGALWKGVALVLWGSLVVGSVDNLIRPWVISASTRLSFLLVLFGVLGGVRAFGLVGLFLGPVILAVLWTVWRHWLDRQGRDPGPPAVR